MDIVVFLVLFLVSLIDFVCVTRDARPEVGGAVCGITASAADSGGHQCAGAQCVGAVLGTGAEPSSTLIVSVCLCIVILTALSAVIVWAVSV